ncbi:hypothetical protein [Brachybacterium sp. GPGPB12]|uniref:hypothetical protein n=1 Tax=Brachybacterium sp. GPGPB12 TaxID=3023517 RepID=UPI0031344BAB
MCRAEPLLDDDGSTREMPELTGAFIIHLPEAGGYQAVPLRTGEEEFEVFRAARGMVVRARRVRARARRRPQGPRALAAAHQGRARRPGLSTSRPPPPRAGPFGAGALASPGEESLAPH